MVEYSYQQKIAMMRILLDIIHADGYIDVREMHFFKELKDLFDLEETDHQYVKEYNSLLALLQIRNFTEEQKMGFALYMSKMIIIDGDINDNEVAIYNVVNEFCDINKEFADNIPQEELKDYTHS
jgi:uncharacterized tellurite resistance protein B-like protein